MTKKFRKKFDKFQKSSCLCIIQANPLELFGRCPRDAACKKFFQLFSKTFGQFGKKSYICIIEKDKETHKHIKTQ